MAIKEIKVGSTKSGNYGLIQFPALPGVFDKNGKPFGGKWYTPKEMIGKSIKVEIPEPEIKINRPATKPQGNTSNLEQRLDRLEGSLAQLIKALQG